MSFTAREVEDALQEHTREYQSPVYKRKPVVPGEYYAKYELDETGNVIVDHEETFTEEFSWNEAEDESLGHTWDVEGIGVVILVDSSPGREGGGEHVWVVVRTETTGQFFRMNGYYSSYEGSEYDGGLFEVTPQERTVTVYE